MIIPQKSNLKVAILHDYLTAYGGAERTLESIIEILPEADIYTSVFWQELLPEKFRSLEIKTSFLQILPKEIGMRNLYRKLAFLSFFFNLKKYDLIICNTSGPANWFLKKNKQIVISYNHVIPSFDRNAKKNLIQKVLSKISRKLHRQIDTLITNSKYNQKEFQEIYGTRPIFIYPPIEDSLYSTF